MACIKLISADGTKELLITANTQYVKAPGDRLVVDKDCENGEFKQYVKPAKKQTLLEELSEQVGSGPGDIIAAFAKPVAALLGKTKCTPCETKRVITNASKPLSAKYGRIKATLLMAELWRMTKRSPEEATIKLQEYLQP